MTNIIAVAVTAFCCCDKCCGPDAIGLTASGRKPVEGITVAASRKIPLGTMINLTVPGSFTNRIFRVDDRLAKRYDDRVDIYMNDHKKALQWGLKKGSFTIIKK